MRELFITLAVFFAVTSLCAQTEANPFAKHGLKKVMMATFSKGEFEEFHQNKEIVEIGSVLYNTKTKEVIGYIDESIENDISSATPAMSIDPHCERYPWISPYAYCMNNPVNTLTQMAWMCIWFFMQQIENISELPQKQDNGKFKIQKDLILPKIMFI